MKMVFTQLSQHHHQQQRDQHEAQTPGNCAKLAAEEFTTFGKYSSNTKGILILPGSVLLEEKYKTTDWFRNYLMICELNKFYL